MIDVQEAVKCPQCEKTLVPENRGIIFGGSTELELAAMKGSRERQLQDNGFVVHICIITPKGERMSCLRKISPAELLKLREQSGLSQAQYLGYLVKFDAECTAKELLKPENKRYNE